MILDLEGFKRAIDSLKISLEISSPKTLMQFDKNTQDVIKAGVIQNFEFTYELSHKMLKRYLAMTAPNPTHIEEMRFSDLIRTGSEQGLLLNGWDAWKIYREARGTTSHAYNAEKANEVLRRVPDFFRDAQFLLDELEKRNRENY